jgi:hypothetical protein
LYTELYALLSEIDCPQRLADFAYVNSSWALSFAGEASCTEPRRLGVEDLLNAELQVSNDQVRQQIHLRG